MLAYFTTKPQVPRWTMTMYGARLGVPDGRGLHASFVVETFCDVKYRR